MRDQWWRAALWGAVPLATLALACMPLLGLRAMVVVIAIWLTLLALRASVDPVPVEKVALRWCLFLALPFLVMLADMLRADDLSSAWKHVERSASLLLFPAGFLLLGAPAGKRFREAMMDLFSAAAAVLAIYANVALAFTEVPPDVQAMPGYAYSYRAMFSIVTSLHPPYAAYFFLAAGLFQLVRVVGGADRKPWRIAAVLLLFVAAALLASRMPLVAFVAAAAAMLLRELPRKAAIGATVSVLLGSLVLVALAPNARQRVEEVFSSTGPPAEQAEVTSTNIRVPIAHCSMETIRAHWLLGTGESGAQTALDECYRQFNIPLLLDGSYGTHDQLLHWWLCFGVVGLLLFIGYFGVLLRTAWKHRDAAHLAFLIFLVFSMFTENLLARQWGVVLFACFNALFIAGAMSDRAATEGRSV